MALYDLIYTNGDSETVNLNDGSTYYLLDDGVRGWFSRPRENLVMLSSSRIQRAILVASVPQAREMVIPIGIQAATRAALWTAIDDLKNKLDADAEAERYGQLSFEKATGVLRNWRLLPVIDTRADDMVWWSAAAARKGLVRFDIHALAIDHLCYDPTPVTVGPESLNGTTPVPIEIVNPGTKGAYIAEIEITGQATNLKIEDENGVWLQFVDAVDTGQTLTLALLPWSLTMTHNVDGSWLNKRATGSSIPEVLSGTHDLTFTGGNAGDDGGVTISVYPTYGGL